MMHEFFINVAKGMVAPIIFLMGLAGYSIMPTTNHQLGSTYNITGGGTYRLKSSIGTTNASITLSSFKEPVSTTKYTMSYLNTTIAYGTLDPLTSIPEFVSFSGITQNADGSAILTGVTRGLARTPGSGGCVASTTLAQAHSGQSIFILSDAPCHYSEYATRKNDENIYGTWTFSSTSPAQYDANITSTGNQFITANQLNSTVLTGVATSTESILGVVRLATAAQAAAGTASSTSGAPLVLLARYATSTYNAGYSNQLIVTGSTNKIAGNFIATSSTDTYNFGGIIGIGTSTPGNSANFGSQLGAYIAGTTTTSNLAVASSTISINGVTMRMPSAIGASSTVLLSNGTNSLLWDRTDWQQLGEQILTGANATSTVTWTGAVKDLMIIFDGAQTAGAYPVMTFNADYAGGGTSYSDRSFMNYTAMNNENAYSGITFGESSTTTARHIIMRLRNDATATKIGEWTEVTENPLPAIYTGTFRWSNTSDQITTVNIRAAGTTWVTGTRLTVYGSKN